MSDNEAPEFKPFAIERAKQGRAKCQKCKMPCEAGDLRLSKLNPNNPFGSGPLKTWYHIHCFFELKKTKTSKTINSSVELDGWQNLSSEDKKELLKKLGPEFKNETEEDGKSAGSTFDTESPKKKPKIESESKISPKTEQIFNGYKLYHSADVREKYREEIKQFEKLGGILTENSISANLVLHSCKEIESNPEALRKLYNQQCRHFQDAWLKDSLNKGKALNPLRYAVKLHQF